MVISTYHLQPQGLKEASGEPASDFMGWADGNSMQFRSLRSPLATCCIIVVEAVSSRWQRQVRDLRCSKALPRISHRDPKWLVRRCPVSWWPSHISHCRSSRFPAVVGNGFFTSSRPTSYDKENKFNDVPQSCDKRGMSAAEVRWGASMHGEFGMNPYHDLQIHSTNVWGGNICYQKLQLYKKHEDINKCHVCWTNRRYSTESGNLQHPECFDEICASPCRISEARNRGYSPRFAGHTLWRLAAACPAMAETSEAAKAAFDSSLDSNRARHMSHMSENGYSAWLSTQLPSF